MDWNDLAWGLAIGALLLALVVDADARPNTCQDWANTVEKLEQLDYQTRAAVIDNMHKLRDHPRYRTLMKAVMWQRAGQTSEAAWRQCESY